MSESNEVLNIEDAATSLDNDFRVKYGPLYGSVAVGLHVLHLYLRSSSTEFHDDVFASWNDYPVCWHFGITPESMT